LDNCFEAARLRRVQPGRLRQFGGGQRRAEIFMASASSTKTISSTARGIRDAQDLNEWQRRITAKSTPWDHDDPPGQCDRPGQGGRLGRPRFFNASARGKPVKSVPRTRCAAPIHVDEIAEIFARVVMKDKPDPPENGGRERQATS